jgi:hypothetical protein
MRMQNSHTCRAIPHTIRVAEAETVGRDSLTEMINEGRGAI